MKLEQIKAAVDLGMTVHWLSLCRRKGQPGPVPDRIPLRQ